MLFRSGGSNVHALVVGVENAEAELDRGLAIDVGGVSDGEGLVVASSSLETFRVGVVGHHGLGGLDSECLTTGIKVGDVADETDGGLDSLVDDGSDCCGTSRSQDSHSDGLALAQLMLLSDRSAMESGSLETSALGRDSSAINNGGASSDGSDEGSERRHVVGW